MVDIDVESHILAVNKSVNRKILLAGESGVTGMNSALAIRQVDESVRDRAYRALAARDCPPEARQALRDLLNELDKPPSLDWIAKEFSLTPTEQTVLELLAYGATSMEIAERMGKKLSTVRVHRQNIYNKTHVNHIAGLLALVIRGPGSTHFS